MSGTWSENWQDRTRAAVQSLGYEDVFAFVMSQPGKPFGELFGMIQSAEVPNGPQVAYVQLPEVFYVDAQARGCLRMAVMEALVRSLRQFLKKGWNQGRHARERRIDACGCWLLPSGQYENWQQLKADIWRELECLAPSDDWCPESHGDPIIQEVFDRVWPTTDFPF